jgi:hypothetical protein
MLFCQGAIVKKKRRYEMEKLPPEKAAEMLRKKGMEVSVEQAALMLALLRMLAGIIVATYLEQGRYP